MAAYNGWETKSGEALGRVEAICRHLTTQGHFTDTSPVSLPAAEVWLDDAYYLVLGELVRNGYNATQTDTEVKQLLTQIQSLDAACQIEFSMPLSDTGEPNERFKGLAARRDRLIDRYLHGDALEQLGATRTRNKSQYLDATGRSIDRKQTAYDNTDTVPARFPRGFGQRRDVPRRSGINSSAGADPNLT